MRAVVGKVVIANRWSKARWKMAKKEKKEDNLEIAKNEGVSCSLETFLARRKTRRQSSGLSRLRCVTKLKLWNVQSNLSAPGDRGTQADR